MIKTRLSKYILMAVAFLALSGGMTWGADYTWTGGDGNWDDPAHWGGGGFPAAGDTATINTAAVITTSTPITVQALVINAGATINLGNSLEITGTGWTLTDTFLLESTGIAINLNGNSITAGVMQFGSATQCSVAITGGGTITTTNADTSDATNNYITMTNGANLTVLNNFFCDSTNSSHTTFSGDSTGTVSIANMYTNPVLIFDGVSVSDGTNTYSLDVAGAVAGGSTVTVTLNGTFPPTAFTYSADVITPTAGETYSISGGASPASFTADVASGTIATASSGYSFTITFPTVVNGHGVTITVFAPDTPNPVSIGAITFVESGTDTVWKGGLSGNAWNEPLNWTMGTPTNATNAVIPQIIDPMNYPIVTAPGAEANTLTIDSGAKLTLGANDLTVTGALTNNGTISLDGTASQISAGSRVTGPSSTIVYTGPAAAPAAWGTSYRNLTVTGTLSLGGTSVTVAGTLENTGIIEINGSGTINKSDNNSGTFRYTVGWTGTGIPALSGYNALEITGGTRTQANALSAASLKVFGPATLQLDGFTATIAGATTNAGEIDINGAGNLSTGSLSNPGLVVLSSTGTCNHSDATQGTFRYTGGWTGTIPLLPESYHDLEITGGTHTQTNGLSVALNLTISGGTTELSTGANVVTVTGTVSGTGTLTGGSGSITVGGDFTPSNFSQSGGTLALNGTVSAFAPTGAIGSLTIGTAANVALAGNMTLTGNLTLNGGGVFTATGGTVTIAPSGASSTISGNPTFNSLSSTGQSGKTLTIDNDISVSGTLTLSGLDASHRLFVNGNGSISLASDQANGNFLSVDSDIDIVAGHTYTAYQSVPTSLPRAANWNLMANTAGNPVWTGTLGTDWNAGGNWDSGAVPGPGETATIGAPEVVGNNPQATAAVTTGTINVLALGIVDFHGQTITVTAINNAGAISLDGTAGQVLGSPAIFNDTTSTVNYTGTLATPILGTSYQNLTVATGAVLSLGATTIVTIGGTLTINGQLNLNGTGSIPSIGTLDNLGTVEISSTGTIQKSDPSHGTFRYATATGSLPALNGYNALVVASGTWTAAAALSAAAIDVHSGATFDLVSNTITVSGTFANSGIVRISGNPTIGGGKSNVPGSTVEYYGAGCEPAWGTGYANLGITSGDFSAGPGLTIAGSLTVSGNSIATFNTNAGQTTQCATATLSTTGNLALGNDAGDGFRITGGALSTPSASGLALAGTLTASGGISLRDINTIADNLTFASAVTLVEPVTLALGTTSTLTINSGITCTTQNFETTGSGLVTVSASATVTATSGSLTFANPVTLGNGASIAASGTGTINLNDTTGTTTIGTGASIASTGTGKITFAGPVANDGAISAGNAGAGATAIEFAGNYSGVGTINGNGTSDPVILFSGAGATISIDLIAPAGDTVRFSGASQSVTPGSSTYANVECTGSGISFGNHDFSQGASANFTVSAGSVSIGTGQFIAGNLIASGGNFAQTGTNGGTQGVTTISSTGGTISWDDTGVGGTLSVGGGITGASASVLFHHKTITFTASGSLGDSYDIYAGTIASPATLTCHAVFRDLTINNGATLVADGGVRVMRNLTIQSGGAYTPSGNTLTLGGAGSESSDIRDENGPPISLGAVDVDATNGPTTKTAQTPLSFSSLMISAGTFASGSNTITVAGNADSTAGSWTSSGTINVSENLTLGAFTGTTSTINLNGTVPQTFTTNAQNLGNLILPLGGNNTIRISGTLNIGINLGINGSQTLDLDTDDAILNVTGATTNNGTITGGSADITFGGNYLGASGTLNAPASTNSISFRGATTTLNAGAGTFSANGGTVIFDGTVAQALDPGSATFHNITVNETGGTLAVNTNDLNCGAGGTLTLTASAGVTFNTPVNVPTLANSAGAFPIAFNANADITGVASTTLGTTGAVTLGNDAGDVLTFANGLTVTNATSKSIAGTIQASSNDIDLSGNSSSITATATIGGTSAGAIKIGDANIASSTTLTLGAAQANVVTAGAISGMGAASNLTINLSDSGSATIASIGASVDTFRVTNSGGVTVSGTANATTVDLTDTANAATIDFQDSVNIGALTTGTAGYNIRFGDGGSVTGATTTTFHNTGDLRIENGLSFTNGSLVATAPVKYIQGTVAVSGTNTINLTGTATNITANATIGGASSGQVDIGTISIAPGATLTLGQGGTGQIVTGAITSPGPGKGNLSFNTRSAALSTIASLGGANIGILTIMNVGSGGLTFTGDVGALATPLNSVVFANTINSTGLVSFTGGIWTAAMTVNAGTAAYRIAFNGGGSVTGGMPTTFSNAGALTIADGFAFESGVTATAQTKDIRGTISANTAGNIDFGTTATTVSANATLDGSSGGSITLADTTLGNNVTLTLGNAADSNTIAIGAITPGTGIEAVTVNNATSALSFNGNIGAAGPGNSLETITLNMTGGSATFAENQAVYLNTLVTTGNGYTITFNSDTAVITNNPAFLNTGALTLGNESTDSISFTNGVTATTPSSVTLAGNIHATAAGASISLGSPAHAIQLATDTRLDTSNGNITLGGTVNDAHGLTLNSGTADILASGSIGNSTPLGDITIEDAGNAEFSATVRAASLLQTAGTGTTTLKDNITTSGVNGAYAVSITNNAIFLDGLTMQANGAAAGSVRMNGPVTLTGGSVAINTTDKAISFTGTVDGPQGLTLDAGTATRQAVSMSAAIGSSNPLDSLLITGSTVDLNGIGSGAQDGVTGTVSVTGTGAVSLYADYYKSGDTQTWTAVTSGIRYLAPVSVTGGTWAAGGTGISCPATDLYLDYTGGTLTLGSNIACRNLYFYRGILSINGHAVTTTADFAVFGANYDANDPDYTGADTRFEYSGLTALPYYPGSFDTYANASFSDLVGSTINVGGNFYVNGANMTASAPGWNLQIPSNASAHPIYNSGAAVTSTQWGTPYAIAFNMTVSNCTATGGIVAAPIAGALPDTGTHHNVTHVVADPTTGWNFTAPRIVSVETIYDNVLKLTFDQAIQNGNGEINAVISSVLTNTGAFAFTGAYSDATCTTLLSSAVNPSSFYIKTTNCTWNTDATGNSASIVSDSTDRENAHQTTVPDLTIPLGAFRAANGKAFIRNYGTNAGFVTTPVYGSDGVVNSGIGSIAGTSYYDHCAPVLIEVHTGQEAHTAADTDAAQNPYDAHNFIEFRWSEPVAITAGAIPVPASTVNMLASGTIGAITASGAGLDVAGLGTIANGALDSASHAYGTSTVSAATHAVYRHFSLAGGPAGDQPHRLRVAIAGYAETGASHGESYAWYWPGFISSATLPTGLVTDSTTALTITDQSANNLEAIGTSAYPRATVTVSNATTALYSAWDVTGPAPAALRMSSSSWGDPITAYEAVPDASGGVIDRVEMHFFDNAVHYDLATDAWAWTSRKGWYLSSDPTKTQLAQSSANVPEAFGGARPEDSPVSAWVPTSGGIREGSLNHAIGAFRVFYNGTLMATQPSTFSTNVSTKLLAPVSNQNVAGDPYFRLYWSGAGGSGLQIAGSTITVSYNADSPATTGYVTDLAGNLMKPFSKITCVDRTPPRITFSLAGANRDDLYVLFSKPIDFASVADIASALTVNLSGTAVALSGTPELKTANRRAFLYHLGSKVRATDLVSASSSIAITGTGNLIQDPDTGVWSETSYFVDELGNYAVVGETHRLTDIGIGLAEILYGSDGVNEPGLLGGQAGALRSESFDGTGRLLDKDITIATWLNLPTAPGSLALYYDVNPSDDMMPKTFNDATGSSLRLWLPSVLSGFNLNGDQDARNLSPTVITDAARLFRNFLIPESDSEIVPGAKVQLIMQYEGLFCARLTNETDITSLAPWSFVVAETRKQRGGVTILNNVIDSNKREKTIVQVEVPKSGNVVIQVFTLDGNIVKVLERGRKGGGTYSYYWDGTNGAGNPVARGIYFIRVVGPDMDEIRKVLVVKD